MMYSYDVVAMVAMTGGVGIESSALVGRAAVWLSVMRVMALARVWSRRRAREVFVAMRSGSRTIM